MRQSEFLAEQATKLRGLLERLPRALEGVDEEEFNRAREGAWSRAMIVDHMLVAAEPYLEAVRPLAANKGGGADAAVKGTFMGRMMARASGPSGNAPVPKAMRPRGEKFSMDLVERWEEVHREILAMAEGAGETDLSQKFANPFVPLLRFNLVDFFEILVGHAERHVGQIEERESK